MSGLPCSGKTTIVRKLTETIPNLAILDGDELREWFSPKDFSKAARDEHNRRVAHLAKLLLKHNVPMGVSLISPYKENRANAKEIIGDDTKFFGDNHSLNSSPSRMARFGMVSASFLTMVVLPEQGNPVIHKQNELI